MNAEFISELNAAIAYRRKYEQRDFMLSETFKWISILSSFGTAIIAATGDADKYVVAIFAAISGLVILIDQKISFASRSTWNALYRIEIQKLLNELDDTNTTDIRKKFNTLQENKEIEFANR